MIRPKNILQSLRTSGFFLIFILVATTCYAGYSLAQPKNLQATVQGKDGNDATVHLSWESDLFGVGYMVTKIFPDGRKMQFTIQGGATADPNCMMKGGVFADPLVENGKTYTYKIKAFDALMDFSAESSVTITIHLGDSSGCGLHRSLSLSPSANNLALNVNWSNPDNQKFDIYVDGKLRKSVKGTSTTIWPVFGENHEVKLTPNNSSLKPSILASTAEACDAPGQSVETTVQTQYSGLLGKLIKWINTIHF